LAATLNAAGGTPMEFIFFGGKRIARRDSGGAVSYFFADHLGTSRVVTNATGGNPEESDFYPFGGERVVTDALPDQNYKFTGKERDTESGLDFFIARHYASNLGRFLQPDEFIGGPVDVFSSNDPLPTSPLPYAVISNPQSLNKYTYVWNNPHRYSDPNGHEPDDLITRISEAMRDPDVTHGIGAGAARFLARTINAFGAVFEPQGKFVPLPMMPTFNEKQETIATRTETALTVLSLVASIPSKPSPAGVTVNRAAGLAFQNAQAAETAATDTNVVQNLRVTTTGGTRTEIDIASRTSSGAIRLQEAKASERARLTPNQAKAHPEIEQSGATVVSRNKAGYPAGSRIPPTKVEVVRPH
jgi:RHS repeat-associated protein